MVHHSRDPLVLQEKVEILHVLLRHVHAEGYFLSSHQIIHPYVTAKIWFQVIWLIVLRETKILITSNEKIFNQNVKKCITS